MYALFDIGGTKTRVALSDGKEIGSPRVFRTPASYEDGIAALVDAVQSMAEGREIQVAAGGVPGVLSADRRTLLSSPHLTAWEGRKIAEDLSVRLAAPVVLENDASVVGLGEAHMGTGVGYDIVAYLTVSTGVGGARIVSGAIDHGRYNFEPGHQIIDLDHTLCRACGTRGEAEMLISGTATANRFGRKAYEIEDPRVWEELAQWVAVVVNNVIVHWSPDVVVLGGSMMIGDPAISVARVAAHVAALCTIYPDLPEIKKAALGDFGGLHGALVLAGSHIAE